MTAPILLGQHIRCACGRWHRASAKQPHRLRTCFVGELRAEYARQVGVKRASSRNWYAIDELGTIGRKRKPGRKDPVVGWQLRSFNAKLRAAGLKDEDIDGMVGALAALPPVMLAIIDDAAQVGRCFVVE